MILKWLIVAVLFVEDVPVNSKLFPQNPATVKTAEDCQKVVDDLHAEAKKTNVDVWAGCIEVKRITTAQPQLKKERDL